MHNLHGSGTASYPFLVVQRRSAAFILVVNRVGSTA